MKRYLCLLLAVPVLLALSTTAFAGTSTAIFAYTPGVGPVQLVLDGNAIGATNTGWYDQTGSHSASNPNYIAGVCGSSDGCAGDDLNRNDFFVFNIPDGQYTTAVLQIYNPGVGPDEFNGFICNCNSLTYNSWDVSTDIRTLVADQTGALGIFNDLGSGVQFGSVVVTAADNGTLVTITLNAAALNEINNAEGGLWAIGGSVGQVPTPEPSSLVLLGSALLGGIALRRKR